MDGKDDELELDWGSRAPRGPGAPSEAPQPAPAAVKSGRGPLGDMPEGLRFRTERFFRGSFLKLTQQVELAQALVGWDQANAFSVMGDDNHVIFTATEQAHGVLSALSRNFNPFYRNTTDCFTVDGSLFTRLHFPFTWFFRRCEVQGWNERPLGSVQVRFHLLKFRADILGTTGNTLLEVHGPMLKFFSFTDWVYEVRRGERVVARIKKHWSGFLREAFTTADRLSIEFEPGFEDPQLRLLVFAAAMTVDLTSFDRSGRRSQGKNLLQTGFDLFG